MTLKGARLLVTNVTGFLGLPAARACAEAGAYVLCHDVDFADPRVRNAFAGAHPGLHPLAAQTPEALAAECGPLACLVANDDHPAIRVPVGPAAVDELRAALEALCVAPFALIAAVVEGMKLRGGGKIVLVTSAAPLRGLANYAPYVTARGAQNALARTLAVELAPANVKVVAFAPNFVESPTYFPQHLLDDPTTRARIERNVPLGRLASPEEAGAVIAFLASPAADFMTGAVVPFAGGWA
jgi:NAD(P)-dependent dehydrogenase (short-subunit alcohol dehydrogenase family)